MQDVAGQRLAWTWGLVLLLAGLALAACVEGPAANPFDRSTPAGEQATGAILGTIELEGRPGRADLAWVEVRGHDLAGTEQGLVRHGPTTEDGRFAFGELRPGSYTVAVSRPFYEDTAPRAVEVGLAGKTVVERLRLVRKRVSLAGQVRLCGVEEGLGAGLQVWAVTGWGLCSLSPSYGTCAPCRDAGYYSSHQQQCELVGDPLCLVDLRCGRAEEPEGTFLPLSGAGDGPEQACLAQVLDRCGDTGCEGAEVCSLPNILPAQVDSDGSFEIRDLPDGRHYWLVAARPGFQTLIRELGDPVEQFALQGLPKLELAPSPSRVRLNCGRAFTNVPEVLAELRGGDQAGGDAACTLRSGDERQPWRFARFSEDPNFQLPPPPAREDLFLDRACRQEETSGCPQLYGGSLHEAVGDGSPGGACAPSPCDWTDTQPAWTDDQAAASRGLLPSELFDPQQICFPRFALSQSPPLDLMPSKAGDLGTARAETEEGPRRIYVRRRDSFENESELGSAVITFDRTPPEIRELRQVRGNTLEVGEPVADRTLFYANACDDRVGLQFRPRDNMGIAPLKYQLEVEGRPCQKLATPADLQGIELRREAGADPGQCTIVPGLAHLRLRLWDGAENEAAPKQEDLDFCWDDQPPELPEVLEITADGNVPVNPDPDPTLGRWWTRGQRVHLRVATGSGTSSCYPDRRDAVRIEALSLEDPDDRPRLSVPVQADGTAEFDWDLWPGDGENVIRLRAVDQAGNWSCSADGGGSENDTANCCPSASANPGDRPTHVFQKITVVRDTQPPVGTIRTDGVWFQIRGWSYWTSNMQARFDLSIHDQSLDMGSILRSVVVNGVDSTARINNGSGSVDLAPPATDGPWVVSPSWGDLAGNEGGTSLTVIVDRNAPHLDSVGIIDPTAKPGTARHEAVMLDVGWHGLQWWDEPASLQQVNGEKRSLAASLPLQLDPCGNQTGCYYSFQFGIVDAPGNSSNIMEVQVLLDTIAPISAGDIFAGQRGNSTDAKCTSKDRPRWCGTPREATTRNFGDVPDCDKIRGTVECRCDEATGVKWKSISMPDADCDNQVHFDCTSVNDPCSAENKWKFSRILVKFIDKAGNESDWNERIPVNIGECSGTRCADGRACQGSCSDHSQCKLRHCYKLDQPE